MECIWLLRKMLFRIYVCPSLLSFHFFWNAIFNVETIRAIGFIHAFSPLPVINETDFANTR